MSYWFLQKLLRGHPNIVNLIDADAFKVSSPRPAPTLRHLWHLPRLP